MTPILDIKNIGIHYGIIPALKQVSLKASEGEIVSLIGANGAGKSSLIKAAMGMIPLESGAIDLRGECIAQSLPNRALREKKNNLTADQITRRGMSLVPEGKGIFSEMTVRENLELGAYIITNKTKVLERLEKNFATFTILAQRQHQKAGSLSGGEQQMLAIARALMLEPQVLLLDEPSLGLAPLMIKTIFELIVTLNRDRRTTILLVEQNAKLALSISHQAYVLENGRIVLHDSGANLLRDPRIRAAYLGAQV